MKKNEILIRLIITGFLFLCFYSVVIFRLWDEQIRQGKEHRDKISKQSIRQIRVPAARGRIFSSDMHTIADNIPYYNIVFHPAEMRQPGKRDKTIKHILASAVSVGKAIGRKCELTESKIIRHVNTRPALPLPVYAALNPKEIIAASEMLPPIQGMEIAVEPVRYYPDGEAACHVVGYVGMDDPSSAEDRSEYFYYIPDFKGKYGLEKVYDNSFTEGPLPLRGLRGVPGKSIVRVDHRGYVFETIDTPARPQYGHDLRLTLDWKAQMAAEEVFSDKNGAFVMLDASTGAVLAMVSSPGFDPNMFVSRFSHSKWKEMNTSEINPFLNRATSGTYTPGSILKPLIAMAILGDGTDPDESVICDGSARVGNTSIKCWTWNYGGHGSVNFLEGMEQSCNVYFIEQGRKAGLDKIYAVLKSAGIGSRTGFCLPEAAGTIPSREEKIRIFHDKWNEYDTCLLCIGQGIILITPLQAANYCAAIANGGTLWKPYIVSELRNPSGVLYRKTAPEKIGELKVSSGNLDLIREGMRLVVNGDKGTAKKARSEKIMLYGKTGTAELGASSSKKNTWFLGFGNCRDKTVALALIVDEKGVSGGSTCAPMVKKILENWID